MKIAIVSASVRTGRKSHRVALFLKKFIESNKYADVEILDLKEYNFPVFEERLQYQKNPSPEALDFAERIRSADGVIIVTPEYNGGYPASLKNAVDLLVSEWKRKPIALASASGGPFAASQVLTSLLFSLWKIGALVVPVLFQTPKVQEAYDEGGNPADREIAEKKATALISELKWCIEAAARMRS